MRKLGGQDPPGLIYLGAEEYVLALFPQYQIKIKMKDQTNKCKYEFRITPLEISEKSSSVSIRQQKHLLVKLGPQTVKFNKFGRTIPIITDVVFSRVFGKFYPLKGMMKVYDVLENGKQVIACVGAFHIDHLLNENKHLQIIDKQIGKYLVKVKVQATCLKGKPNPKAKSLSSFSEEQQFNSAGEKQKSHYFSTSQKKTSKTSAHIFHKQSDTDEDKITTFQKKNQIKNNQQRTQNLSQSDHNSKSLENISFSCSEILDDFKKREIETLGEELIEERRKTRMLEEMIEKLNIKIQVLKKKNKYYDRFNKKCQKQFEEFIKNLESDDKGHYLFELNEKRNSLTIKYKKNINFQRIFLDFLNVISKQIQMKSKGNDELQHLSSTFDKIDQLFAEKQKVQLLVEEKQKQNKKFKQTINQLTLKLHQNQESMSEKVHEMMSYETKLTSYQQMMLIAEETIRSCQHNEKKLLVNLQRKIEQTQELLIIISQLKSDLDDAKKQSLLTLKAKKNLELTIEELKEELSQREEEVQVLMEKGRREKLNLSKQFSEKTFDKLPRDHQYIQMNKKD